jgi:hypothetical protein
MKHAPGKLKEKVVTILEKHIDHNAKVTCDVFLPVVAHPEMNPRQIDVLIETGTKSRPTYTIVEVQDRTSKPSRGEFDGWLEKMKEVGAQHLICVTKAGYTKSQIKKASFIGPSVRLFTLSQIESIDGKVLPPSLMGDKIQVVTYEKLEGIRIDPVHLYQMHPDIDPKNLPDPHYKMFIPYPKKEFVSATEVTDWHLFANPKNLDELPKDGTKFTLKFGYDFDQKKPWRFKSNNGSVLLKRLDIQIQLTINEYSIDWEQSKYEQLGQGEIGWLLKGTTSYKGKEVKIYIPLRKETDELYYAGQPYTENKSGDTFVQYGKKGFKAIKIEEIKTGNKKD